MESDKTLSTDKSQLLWLPFSSRKDLVKFLNEKHAEFLSANEDNCPQGSFQNFQCSVVILKTEKEF